MIGIKESRFNSRPNHAVNHEVDENAIKVPVKRVEKNKS